MNIFLDILKCQKILHIPNGIDLDEFKDINFPTIPSEYIFPEIINCIYTGSLGEANSVTTIIDAFCLIKKNGFSHKFNLYIYGDGPKFMEIKRKIIDFNIDNVYLNRSVPKNSLREVFENKHVCLLPVPNLPNLYKFGISPNKLFDYMAFSRPVIICTNINSPIIDNYNGFNVSPESPHDLCNCLISLLDVKYSNLITMGKNARSCVELRYSFEKLSFILNRSLISIL